MAVAARGRDARDRARDALVGRRAVVDGAAAAALVAAAVVGRVGRRGHEHDAEPAGGRVDDEGRLGRRRAAAPRAAAGSRAASAARAARRLGGGHLERAHALGRDGPFEVAVVVLHVVAFGRRLPSGYVWWTLPGYHTLPPASASISSPTSKCAVAGAARSAPRSAPRSPISSASATSSSAMSR